VIRVMRCVLLLGARSDGSLDRVACIVSLFRLGFEALVRSYAMCLWDLGFVGTFVCSAVVGLRLEAGLSGHLCVVEALLVLGSECLAVASLRLVRNALVFDVRLLWVALVALRLAVSSCGVRRLECLEWTCWCVLFTVGTPCRSVGCCFCFAFVFALWDLRRSCLSTRPQRRCGCDVYCAFSLVWSRLVQRLEWLLVALLAVSSFVRRSMYDVSVGVS
jgi:hypothetical protein